jgi:hypothetical protein
MKRILTTAAMIAMFVAPAFAGDAKIDTKAKTEDAAAATKTHDPETVHPPTNRVGETLPEMTQPTKDAQLPTGRIGKSVPTMTAPDEKEKMSGKLGDKQPEKH